MSTTSRDRSVAGPLAGLLVAVLLAGFASSDLPAQPDPDLEAGFPVQQTLFSGGVRRLLVGDIDGDLKLEVVLAQSVGGAVLAYRSDGSPVPGPVQAGIEHRYPSLGQLSASSKGLEIVQASHPELRCLSSEGATLTGWPQPPAGSVTRPATLVDIGGDGVDEIFIGENDARIHGYDSQGSPLPGWPPPPILPGAGNERQQTTAADLDGDGIPEILTATPWSSGMGGGIYVIARHFDATLVSGFPVFLVGHNHTFLAVGDVDGDGAKEIVLVTPSMSGDSAVTILNGSGAVETVFPLTGIVSGGTPTVLADLTGDGQPEIVVQGNGALTAVGCTPDPSGNAQCSLLPGWPQDWNTPTSQSLGNSSPAVGDVDGDLLPDIVVTSQDNGATQSHIRVYSAAGVLHPSFPKQLDVGAGMSPAIADLDLDGRNEIIAGGAKNLGGGNTGFFLWVYDLGGGQHGGVEWGQYGGDARRRGEYRTASRGPGAYVNYDAATHRWTFGVTDPDGWSTLTACIVACGYAPGPLTMLDPALFQTLPLVLMDLSPVYFRYDLQVPAPSGIMVIGGIVDITGNFASDEFIVP